MARGMMNLDLGLSDTEDSPPRRLASADHEESISELLGGRDSTRMFSGQQRRRSNAFTTRPGMDPLDALSRSMGGGTFASSLPEDEDDEEFRRLMEEQLATAGLTDVPAVSGGATSSRGARSPSPAIAASGLGDSEGNIDMDDLLGAIMDDQPARPTPKKASGSVPSSGTSPIPRVGGDSPGNQIFHRDPEDSYGEVGMARNGREFERDCAGMQKNTSGVLSDLPGHESDLAMLAGTFDEHGRSTGDSDAIGFRPRGKRRSAAPTLTRDGPLDEILGFATRVQEKTPSPSLMTGSQSLGAPLDVELNIGPKPKRRLGKAKAQPSTGPSRAATPPIAEPESASGKATPQSSGRAPVESSDRTSVSPRGAANASPVISGRSPTYDTMKLVRGEEDPADDSGDLDDLLRDNTKYSTPRSTTPPRAASDRSAPVTGETNSQLGFRGGAETGQRKELQTATTRNTPSKSTTPPKVSAQDLGFDASDQSRSGSNPAADDSGSDPAASGFLHAVEQRANATSVANASSARANPHAAVASDGRLSDSKHASRAQSPGSFPQVGIPVACRPSHSSHLPTSCSDFVPPTHQRAAATSVPSRQQAHREPEGAIPSATSPQGPSSLSSRTDLPAHPGIGLPSAYAPQQFGLKGVPPCSPARPDASVGGPFRQRTPEYLQTDAANVAAGDLHTKFAPISLAERDRQGSVEADCARKGPGSIASEQVPSLFGNDPAMFQVTGGGDNVSAYPPLVAAPSADLMTKLAFSDAKCRWLELQLDETDQRWQQRLADLKRQCDAERERLEIQCRRMELEMENSKERHVGELNHMNEKRLRIAQNVEAEKENERKTERRKMQLELDKLKASHEFELEELRRKQERALHIAQQTSELEIDNIRKVCSGEEHLAKLVEQVQGSLSEVGRMSKRVESDKSLEWTMRERQLEAREQVVRDMEGRLSVQTKEVEDQRQRMSELVRQMQDRQVDDRSVLAAERERLETEHARLLDLQRTLRESDRHNRESLKHAWAQLEEARRSFEQKQITIDGELSARKEEVDVQERRIQNEQERLKSLHGQVESARQNAARRIRETETTIANERRCLMNDMEIFEEKRRIFTEEVQRLESERKDLDEQASSFDTEVQNVGAMAAEVQKKSEDLRSLHEQTAEAQIELKHIRGAIHDERMAQNTELERLKAMQTLIEQQRLHLLQTENQLRIRGVEDVDFLLTTQASFPMDVQPLAALESGYQTYPALSQPQTAPSGISAPALEPPPGGASRTSSFPWLTSAPSGVAAPAFEPHPGGASQTGCDFPWCAASEPPVSEAATAGRFQGAPLPWAQQSTNSSINPDAASEGGGTFNNASRKHAASHPAQMNRGLATPCRNQRMELQTLLRRTREASGDMQIFMQESYRLIQDPTARIAAPLRPMATNALPSSIRSGFGTGGPLGIGNDVREKWQLPIPPSSESTGSFAPLPPMGAPFDVDPVTSEVLEDSSSSV